MRSRVCELTPAALFGFNLFFPIPISSSDDPSRISSRESRLLGRRLLLISVMLEIELDILGLSDTGGVVLEGDEDGEMAPRDALRPTA